MSFLEPMNATCLALGLRTDSLHLQENMWPNNYNSQQDRLSLLSLGLRSTVYTDKCPNLPRPSSTS